MTGIAIAGLEAAARMGPRVKPEDDDRGVKRDRPVSLRRQAKSEKPPSTRRVWPLMKRLRGLAKKATASAISSGSA